VLHLETYGRCVASLPDRRRRSFGPYAWRLSIGLLVVVAMMSWGRHCLAQDWVVTPSVSLYGSFTSNANLNLKGQGDPDFFTTLVPAVDIRGDTSRLKLNFDYSLAAIAFASDPNLDQLRNNLNFVSTAPLTTYTPRSHAVPWPTGALGRPPQPRKCRDEAGGYCDYTAELVLGGPQIYSWGFACAIEN
jgi:hypothetical protein